MWKSTFGPNKGPCNTVKKAISTDKVKRFIVIKMNDVKILSGKTLNY